MHLAEKNKRSKICLTCINIPQWGKRNSGLTFTVIKQPCFRLLVIDALKRHLSNTFKPKVFYTLLQIFNTFERLERKRPSSAPDLKAVTVDGYLRSIGRLFQRQQQQQKHETLWK